MLRFILTRKIFKCWMRQFAPRRDRTPSSLQECLDSPPPRRGLWRHWFILLVVAPILYYIIFIGTSSQEYQVVKKWKASGDDKILTKTSIVSGMERDKQHYPAISTLQIPRPGMRNAAASPDLHQHSASSKKLYVMDNGTLRVGSDGNNSFYVMSVPGRHLKFTATTSGPIPRKFLPFCVIKKRKTFNMEPRNITTDMAYRKKLYSGGLYVPANCRSRHKVAILVPYRNRQTNLAVFLYNMHPFLIEQSLEYRIFVIEQSGQELFNKGRLFNAGFMESQKYGHWDCMVFHDVDLLPTSSQILYTCPTWPRHMSAYVVGKQNVSHYKSLFGGVTSMLLKHYRQVNGYSNLYWGWGGEDTDMFWRIKASGVPIMRYSRSVAKYIMLPHSKSPEDPIRYLLTANHVATKHCQSITVPCLIGNRRQLSNKAKERYKSDGLSSLKYQLLGVTYYQTYTHFLIEVNPEKENITEFQNSWGR